MAPISDTARLAEECREFAKTFTTHEQKRQMSIRGGTTTSEPTFLPEAFVWLSAPTTATGLSSKLQLKYEDPCSVVERKSPVIYLIEPIEPSSDMRRRGRDIVSVERLKAYYDRLIVTSC